jgi:hypothetical protein
MPGIRLVDARAALAALAALGLAGLAALALAIVTHVPAPAASGPATQASSTGLSRLQSLPLQAQSVISSTLGTGSRSFAAHRTASGWGLSGGGVRADFRAGEPTLSLAGGSTLSLSLAGAPVTSVTTHGNRVTLARAGIREWYAAGPLGVEQSFTLAHQPVGATTGHELTLSLAVGGSLRARVAGSDVNFVGSRGVVAARYGGLTAVDAAGRRLPSTLSVENGRVLIAVNDRGATYPITIDPLVQQGPKLVPNNEQGNGVGSEFGISAALSADGNTALVGGTVDNSDIGAAWVFTRSGSTWTQQAKLFPNDTANGLGADFGKSVALSADGNTALIGGNLDNGQSGAAWVYTRSGSSWTRQGPKLVGSGGAGGFGGSVALSADGNTALIGAPDDSTSGTAWVFTRSGTSWSPQTVLSPNTTNVGNARFGASVALSSDGNIALIGGPTDNTNEGAAWVFTRSGTTWSPTGGTKLVPSDEANPISSHFGTAVDLSSDGNTAVIGGPDDNNPSVGGAAWVFTRTGATWSQQGSKLLPTNASGGNTQFGDSVAVSADGNIALIGANLDANMVGAAYRFTRSGTSWTEESRLTGQGEVGFGNFGASVGLASDGQTALVGGPADLSGTGAAWVFAPPDPVCSSVAATAPTGGGAVAVSLSCTLPAGAHPTFAVLGGPSNGALSGLNAGTGQLTYSSNAFFSGQDSFTYRVSDQWGISNIATATLSVPFLPVPSCSNVTAKGKAGATKVTVPLKCAGPAGHPFSYVIVSQPGNGKLGKLDQSSGRITYSTHVGFGGSDRFVYQAANAGGFSKTATATVVFPALSRISSTMGWNFVPTHPTNTVVQEMIVKTVPGRAQVKLSCTGRKCPIKPHTVGVAKHKVCKGKGKKRKCRSVLPKTGNVDLTHFVAGRHVPVGDKILVAIVQSGALGKEFVFRIIPGKQPVSTIVTLAPGTTKPCPAC